MSRYWSSIVRDIQPYTPGEQPKDKKYIKLNTNENPYPPSPRVLAALRDAVNEDLKLYPDPNCDALKTAIARRRDLSADQVFTGNGSDEVLAFAFLAFFDPGTTILFTDITYSFYPVYADFFRINYKTIPLNEDFSLPIDGFFKRNDGIIVANPNAPTGQYIFLDAIKEILDHNKDVVVVLDEAYIAFGGESAVRLIGDYPNLLIIHTLSKSHSLAGLRVGYAMGNRDLIAALERVKNSVNNYTLDRLSIVGAIEAMNDEEYSLRTAERVIQTRERIYNELLKLGFQCAPSKANFLFITHPRFNGELLFKALRERGILVRYFNKPRISDYLRVSIGSDADMDVFISVVKDITSNA